MDGKMGTLVNIKIYGCHVRDENINKCKEVLFLSDSDIVYDDRPNGGNAYYTFRKALLEPVPEGVTHRLVLPDDMQLCSNFKERLDKLVDKFPRKVIELYPFDYNFMDELKSTPYFRVITLAACGIVFPVKIINEMIEWIDNCYTKYTNHTVENLIDDIAVQTWCDDFRVDTITTLPALVQHIGDVSLLGDFPVRRTKWFIDDLSEEEILKVNWDSDEIKEYHAIPISVFDNIVDYKEMYITNYSKKRSSLGDTF